MKKRYLFISCEEAKQICDKAQYNEATGWERFKLTLRLCWCGLTRSYSKGNKKLTKSMHSAKVDCLKPSEKEHIKSTFEKELAKH